jgi:hypothetical protein
MQSKQPLIEAEIVLARYGDYMETIIMNMRWAGYLLIAIGLINWRYQNSFAKGAPLWIFGLLLIAGTFMPTISRRLTTKLGITAVAISVTALLVVAFAA